MKSLFMEGYQEPTLRIICFKDKASDMAAVGGVVLEEYINICPHELISSWVSCPKI
jgi:hypothetical protein